MKIHDHLDGSAHCVECGGSCRLTGDDLEVTRLVRFITEYFAMSHVAPRWSFIDDALTNLLGTERKNEFHRKARAYAEKGNPS
jgi:hypothetical protein